MESQNALGKIPSSKQEMTVTDRCSPREVLAAGEVVAGPPCRAFLQKSGTEFSTCRGAHCTQAVGRIFSIALGGVAHFPAVSFHAHWLLLSKQCQVGAC